MRDQITWLRKSLRRAVGCKHEFEQTGRSRSLFIFIEIEWGCKHCTKTVCYFPHIDPHTGKPFEDVIDDLKDMNEKAIEARKNSPNRKGIHPRVAEMKRRQDAEQEN
tara:strand:+ start:147 stop:467 length:321 start_codon:yes stop_codon:yes gene_type:complete